MMSCYTKRTFIKQNATEEVGALQGQQTKMYVAAESQAKLLREEVATAAQQLEGSHYALGQANRLTETEQRRHTDEQAA